MLVMQALIGGAAAIMLVLGLIHMVYTFYGERLAPRDAALRGRMQQVSPVLTRHTTMWRCWVGFNASHSLGAILFGLVYGYLALLQPTWLQDSPFLLAVGLATIGTYAALGRAYWFRVPNTGILIALVSYAAGAAEWVLQ
jgi:hypothetical protein